MPDIFWIAVLATRSLSYDEDEGAEPRAPVVDKLFPNALFKSSAASRFWILLATEASSRDIVMTAVTDMYSISVTGWSDMG